MRNLIVASALCVSAIAQAETASVSASPALVERGWAPHLVLAGQGDRYVAVPRIRDAVRLQQNVLLRMRMDDDAKYLTNQFWDRLEDFNLKNLYTLMPEQHSDWRGVAFSGTPSAGGYFLQRDKAGINALTENKAEADPLAFGEVKAAVALKPVEDLRGSRYSIRQAGEIGVGKVSWISVLEASRETLAIMARETSSKELPYLPEVKRMAPQLSEQDQRIVAQLWAAFPNSWNAFSHTATLARVTSDNDALTDAQHLTLMFVGDKNRLAVHYPLVEKYLERMGDVMDATIVLENQAGQWITLRIDSKKMEFGIDMWLKEGRLLAARNGKPLTTTLNKDWSKQAEFKADITMRFQALGVVTTLKDWQMDWRYDNQGKTAVFAGALKDKPSVSIEGRALGVMPASWLAHMPVDIYQIVDQFMSVVAESNEGKGALVSVVFDESDAERAKVKAAASWDGLDNFFVRMGVSMVIDKVVPDAPTSDEIRGLLFDSQIAFSRDLERFAANMELANASP